MTSHIESRTAMFAYFLRDFPTKHIPSSTVLFSHDLDWAACIRVLVKATLLSARCALFYQFWNMSTVCSGSRDGVWSNTLLLTNLCFLLPSPHDIQTLGIDVYGLMFLLCEIMQLYELQMLWIWRAEWRSWPSSVVLLCPVTSHHKK